MGALKAFVIKQDENGAPVAEIFRPDAISEAIYLD